MWKEGLKGSGVGGLGSQGGRSCCTGQGSQPGRLGGEQVAGVRPEWKELPFPAWVEALLGMLQGMSVPKQGCLRAPSAEPAREVSRANEQGEHRAQWGKRW